MLGSEVWGGSGRCNLLAWPAMLLAPAIAVPTGRADAGSRGWKQPAGCGRRRLDGLRGTTSAARQVAERHEGGASASPSWVLAPRLPYRHNRRTKVLYRQYRPIT